MEMKAIDHCLNDKPHFLESVFDAIQDGIIVMDRDFTIVRANRWIQEKYAAKTPLVGKKCHEVFLDRPDSRRQCPFMTPLQGATRHTEILAYPSEAHPTGWFEVSVFRLEDVGGTPIGAIGHLKDITERKRAEDLLKDELTRRRILVDQSRDGIVVLDQDGKVFEANQKYAQMLGYSMAEVHRLHVWDWDTQWTKEELLEMVRSVDQTGDHFETRHRRKDGTLLDVEISTNGAVYRRQKLIFCVCRDITARKRAEEEREKLIRELQEATKEIKTLRGILPLCSFCKKIRDDKGYWEQVDVYLLKHSQADISHSVCPDCMKKYYPEIEDD